MSNLNSNLISLNNFDGNSNDSSGNGYTCTVTGATLTTDEFGKANSAYNLAGGDLLSLVNVGSALNQDFTLSALVYPTTISGVAQRIFISSGDRYGFHFSNGTQLTAFVYNTTYRTINIPLATAGISINNWYHITMTYTNSDTSIRMYVNGILKGTLVVTGGTILTSPTIYLGNWSSLLQGFIGKISSTRVYSRALTDSEVAKLSVASLGNHSITDTGEYLTHNVSNIGQTDGLVGLYTFDGNANDVSGNGYNPSTNSAIATTDEFGNDSSAYSFDGVSQRMQITGFGLDNRVVQTQIFRVYANDISTSPCIFTNGNLGAINLLSTQQIRLELPGTGSMRVTSPVGSILPNTWYTIAIRYNNTLPSGTARVVGDADIFINGVIQTKGSTVTGNATNTFTTLNIGCYNGSSLFFNGKISSTRVYNIALSDSEIMKISNVISGAFTQIKGKTNINNVNNFIIPISGAKAIYKMDGNANDSSGNNIHGTVTNATLTTNQNGEVNSAYLFNGTNSYINLGDNLDAGLTNFSYSLWFKTSSVGALTGVFGKSKAGAGGGRWGFLFESGLLYSLLSISATLRNISVSQTPYIDGNWHLFTATINRSGNHTAYLDGVSIGSVAINADVAVDAQTTYPLGIGAYQNAAGNAFTQGFFNGSIADIIVWNRELTQGEVTQLYNSRKGMNLTKGSINTNLITNV